MENMECMIVHNYLDKHIFNIFFQLKRVVEFRSILHTHFNGDCVHIYTNKLN
jgi:hypothetical protein